MKLTETQLKKIINEEFGKYLESLSPEELQHLIDEGWMSDMGSKAKKGIAALGVAGALAGGGLSPSDAQATPVGGGQGIEQVSTSPQMKEVFSVIQETIKRLRGKGQSMGMDASEVKNRMKRGEITDVDSLVNNDYVQGRPWYPTLQEVVAGL